MDARNIRNIKVLMRPINSMIEFKQIIGRGTRLFDGKDYFTIYDFVKAHHHFSDPEWDGEPLEPEPCSKCKQDPCVCVKTPPQPCPVCGQAPCTCPPGPETETPPPPRRRAKVKLADGKERTIQHMMATTLWHPDGTTMSAQQFMEMLFGKLPDFFQHEEELRSLWSAPDTRAQLLQGLAEKGFGHDQLAEMQKIIDAEKSDLFDVLAHVAYALPPVTREVRAANAKVYINSQFTTKQRAFLDFVLSHYVSVGVGRTRPGEADAAASPQIPQFHRRCSCRPRQARGRSEEYLRGSRSTCINRWTRSLCVRSLEIVMEPTRTTAKRLFALSRNRCAFPQCGVPLVEDEGTITGIICHIRARKPGGPQSMSKHQTEDDRHAFANLILMCSRHSKVIDSDPRQYTVGLLESFKVAT